MYILSTGCQWRAIPKDLPPKSTIYDYFDLWTYGGTLEQIHHTLYEQCREQAEREASPTEAYPVDSGGARYSVLSDRIRAVVGTDIDGQGALAFPISEGIF